MVQEWLFEGFQAYLRARMQRPSEMRTAPQDHGNDVLSYMVRRSGATCTSTNTDYVRGREYSFSCANHVTLLGPEEKAYSTLFVM